MTPETLLHPVRPTPTVPATSADAFALKVGLARMLCGGVILDKPGNLANARKQLAHMSGKTARFDTAVALLDAKSGFIAFAIISRICVFSRPPTRANSAI